jgi:hypothetical protein
MAPQLDLFAPKPERVEWRDDEQRGLTGRIGTATIAIRVIKTRDGFRWRGEFTSPVLGTSLPWSRDARDSATDAFAEASDFLRAWLQRNDQKAWEKRFTRWLETKSAFDLAA